MTREEQIQQAEINYSVDTMFDGCDYIGQVAKQESFIAGAKWADAHPQFSKEKFIEKACWWLRETAHFYVSDFTCELDDNGLLEDFKRAMEE